MRIPELLTDKDRDRFGQFSAEVLTHDYREQVRALPTEKLPAELEKIAMLSGSYAGAGDRAAREIAIIQAEILRRQLAETKATKPTKAE